MPAWPDDSPGAVSLLLSVTGWLQQIWIRETGRSQVGQKHHGKRAMSLLPLRHVTVCLQAIQRDTLVPLTQEGV